LGCLTTRHIIWAAASATVAIITIVRMLNIFHEPNLARHRAKRPTYLYSIRVPVRTRRGPG
jgi:hypothetical protein